MKFAGPSGEVLKSNSIPGDEFVITYANICRKVQEEKRVWVDMLRSNGIKAAHPDDGWVNRKENKVHFAYPQFDDGISIGDKVALGHPKKWRVVEITDIEQELLLWYTFTAC